MGIGGGEGDGESFDELVLLLGWKVRDFNEVLDPFVARVLRIFDVQMDQDLFKSRAKSLFKVAPLVRKIEELLDVGL